MDYIFQEGYSFFPFAATGALNVQLLNCGHEHTGDRRYCWDGLRRGRNPIVIFQATFSGMGALRMDGVTQPVPPGAGFLLIVPEAHCYFLPEDSAAWEFGFVTLAGAEALRLARMVRRHNGFQWNFGLDSPIFARLDTLMARAREGRIATPTQASLAAYEFMMELYDATESGGAPGNPAAADAELARIVRDYVLAHLADAPDVARLARVAHCSYWHFTRRFARLGLGTVHEFVLKMRLELAVGLLQTTRKSVKEIAAECGFASSGYFCRVFRSAYGLPPERFRSGDPDGE